MTQEPMFRVRLEGYSRLLRLLLSDNQVEKLDKLENGEKTKIMVEVVRFG